MKRQITTIIILVVFFLFISPKKVDAAIDCDLANWDADNRVLTVCTGKYSSIEDMNGAEIEIKCLGNSNNPDFSVCSGIEYNSGKVTLGGYTRACLTSSPPACGTCGDDCYYTCLNFTGLNRAIGKVEAIVTHDGDTCTTQSANTKPSDWNPLTEGMPWNKGTNNPYKGIWCPGTGQKINTALGCISTEADPQTGLIASILKLAVVFGGGLALIIIVYGVFIITTSAGVPDKLKEGQAVITSAIAGLVMILLSILLINFIGISILGLPGLK